MSCKSDERTVFETSLSLTFFFQFFKTSGYLCASIWGEGVKIIANSIVKTSRDRKYLWYQVAVWLRFCVLNNYWQVSRSLNTKIKYKKYSATIEDQTAVIYCKDRHIKCSAKEESDPDVMLQGWGSPSEW